jgi:flagellin
MSTGLSIATNTLANAASENLARNQAALQTSVTRLSTGLRINAASDDPSGLAISQSLQSQIAGFDQATQNVQNATNAASIADGALAATTTILQRIRTLAVQAASDISSTADKANLQTEISQLLLEVNRIAQNTSFNGVALLDGSHAGFQQEQNAFLTISSNSVLASATQTSSESGPVTVTAPNYVYPLPGAEPTGTLSGLVVGTTYTFTGTVQPGFFFWGLTVGGATIASGLDGGPINATFVANAATETFGFGVFGTGTFEVTGITATPQGASATVPVTSAAGLLVVSAVAANANFNTTATGAQGFTTGATGTLDGTIEIQVVNTGTSIAALETFFSSAATTSPASVSPILQAPNTISTLFDNVAITFGNFATADVGTSAYIKISQNVAAASNPNAAALNIQSGANEGSTLAVGFAAVDSQALRISNINVLLSSASSPSLGAEDAIGQIDNALQVLLGIRATIGSAIVRLGEDAQNDSGAAVNLQASESSISDLNVGSETTNFNKLQLLGAIGTTVLSNAESNAASVLRLFH